MGHDDFSNAFQFVCRGKRDFQKTSQTKNVVKKSEIVNAQFENGIFNRIYLFFDRFLRKSVVNIGGISK